MQSQFHTGSLTVDQMSRLHISGNIIPVTWFKTIRKATGKPNLNAIIILADIVYWYRPVEIRDELTGELIGLRKKFHSDILQRSYQQIADQFGITKRDATNAVVELEKLGVVKRIFRTLRLGGQQIPNVLFLDLNVKVLEHLTYPDGENRGYPSNRGHPSPKSAAGTTEISQSASPFLEGGYSQIGETNTENTKRDFSKIPSSDSYAKIEEQIKIQISYDVLKHDYPFDNKIDEILGILLDVMTSSADTIRVNREEKPAEIVKAQFGKLTMEHIQFVLSCMEKNTAKVTNIRSLYITALYNSVNTISSYYSSLYNYHMATGLLERREEEKNEKNS